MKVLVTGGAGFIGSHIVDLLYQKGHKVIVVDNLVTGHKGHVHPDVPFYKVDITHKHLDNIIEHELPEVIIHQAAQAYVYQSVQNPLLDGRVNVMGTLNILQSAKRHKVRKIIYASSGAVYGEPQTVDVKEDHPVSPVSFYAASKWMGEIYTRMFQELYQMEYTILRYANVYGPRQEQNGEGRVISTFIQNMKKGIPPTIYGDGNQIRDFIYVKDVAEVSILAMYKGENQTFNIGTGTGTTINLLYQQLADMLKFTHPPQFQSERTGDTKYSCLNSSKAKKELEWQPSYPLSAGLNETIKYFKYK